mmetsp:Transcript_8545/g.12379  ORF Transcript_8545/g.12379 Transcript_8545/m.12379 type:complete len:95 (+) Transcript_8545:837-1121(+)
MDYHWRHYWIGGTSSGRDNDNCASSEKENGIKECRKSRKVSRIFGGGRRNTCVTESERHIGLSRCAELNVSMNNIVINHMYTKTKIKIHVRFFC